MTASSLPTGPGRRPGSPGPALPRTRRPRYGAIVARSAAHTWSVNGGPNRELSEFLRHARARRDPKEAGLLPDSRIRRVPGLRREEVALLAGVSCDYYARLEQGRPISPSPAVVDAIAKALDLDRAGRSHLLSLVVCNTRSRDAVAHPAGQRARTSLRQFVESVDAPAMVLGRLGDVLAANELMRSLLCDFERLPGRHRNYVRWILTDPAPRSLFVDWQEQARIAVHNLRLDIGRHPQDANCSLIQELSASSPEFGVWWNEHAVDQRTFGTKRFTHPVVGRLDVQYETLLLPGDVDQTLFVYSTQPDTASREAMNLLTSWTLTSRT